jgi:hypothetical protein
VNVQLLHVLRLVIRVDSDPARQALFAKLLQARPAVRWAYRLHERIAGTWASVAFVSCYGLAALLRVAPSRNRHARVLVVATHANARREVTRVATWVGLEDCGWLRTGAGALFSRSALSAFALFSWHRVITALRIIRSIDGRYGFLVSCRAAGAIAWYARSKAILAADRPGAVLVSSDSHPEEAGFVSAARTLSIPQVFVAHAYPTPLSPPLDFTVSILEGEAAVDARRRKGAIRGRVLLAGIAGDSFPMDAHRFVRPNPIVGIFPPKALSWQTMAALVEECRSEFHARQIVIRWHPSMLETPHLARLLHDTRGIVESPRSGTVQEAALQCDWVVGDENSNVHLPVMKLGIPSIAVRHLGVYPESRSDQYGFIASGVVYPAVHSLREIDPEAFISFFSECWASRFAQHDASYFRSQDAIGSEVRQVVRALFEEPSMAATG